LDKMMSEVRGRRVGLESVCFTFNACCLENHQAIGECRHRQRQV
jgi:hypothetical protein